MCHSGEVDLTLANCPHLACCHDNVKTGYCPLYVLWCEAWLLPLCVLWCEAWLMSWSLATNPVHGLSLCMYPQAVVTGVDLSPYFLAVGTYENSKRMVRTEDLGWV